MAAVTFGREGQREFLLEGVVVPFQTGATNTVKQAGCHAVSVREGQESGANRQTTTKHPPSS